MVNLINEIENKKYIKQLEEENQLLKHRLLNEVECSNKLLMNERLKYEQITKENIMLRQKIAYLTLFTK
jgi:hypothetical protein